MKIVATLYPLERTAATRRGQRSRAPPKQAKLQLRGAVAKQAKLPRTLDQEIDQFLVLGSRRGVWHRLACKPPQALMGCCRNPSDE
jgi:hypothetical protein